MKYVMFKKAGLYAICGGVAGVLEVENDGDVHEVSNEAALQWVDNGVALIVEPKNGAEIYIDLSSIETEAEGDDLPEINVAEEDAPKKRGRKPKR